MFAATCRFDRPANEKTLTARCLPAGTRPANAHVALGTAQRSISSGVMLMPDNMACVAIRRRVRT